MRWQWEVKTVNGRALEMRLRLPPGHEALDADVRRLCQGRITRGSAQIGLSLTREGGSTEIRVNEAALEQVTQAIARIRMATGAGPPSAEGIAQIRGVLEIIEPEDSEAAQLARRQAMLDSFAGALERLVEARAAEGARLATTLTAQVKAMEVLVAEAEATPSRHPERIAARLREQIDRLLQNTSGFDPVRLHQEAVLLATKADIAEELQRLRSHVAAARELMAAGEPVGRKLDFLAQEFNREANTLCSKANDTDLTRIGLSLKAVIDQWREQVQNVE